MCTYLITTVRCRNCNDQIDLLRRTEYCSIYRNHRRATCKRRMIHNTIRTMCFHYSTSYRCKNCNNLVDFTFYDDFCVVYNNKLATCKRTPIHDDKTVDESKYDVCKAKDTPAQ
uniref:Uncharacterized protein n=1 Tax=Gibberella zeae TaxID=5518 RepID=A0A4E9E884_GIBZA